MKKQFQTFEELLNQASSHLSSLSYSELSISRFASVWKDVYLYMREHGIKEYNGSVGTRYLLNRSKNAEYKDLSRIEKRYIRAVSVLSDFEQSGAIRKKRIALTGASFNGEIGKSMSEYIDYLKTERYLSKQTIKSSSRQLSVFLKYLNTHRIFSLKKLDNKLVFDFVNSLSGYTVESRKSIVQKIRQFLKHQYDNKKITVDYCQILSSFKFSKHRKLPSCYSTEEISRLEKNVDRANPTGKRDYAMILLAARLGLRSSDIIGLQFEDIAWERELIILVQKKTKVKIELPLLHEVGEAIINYLKHGRPQSKLPYVFLCHKTPYSEMNISNFNGFLKKYLLRSGISFDERHHGPHALRHSLATNLLQKETPLPVISEVLGHTSSQSTMCYLKVDVPSLRKCALEVPVTLSKPINEK